MTGRPPSRVTVHTEPAALLFPVLVAAQYLWMTEAATVTAAAVFAVTLTVVHVVHESGHAVAAVRSGGRACMRFSFMQGTVETDNVDDLSLRQRAFIAAAGPAAGIVAAVVLLVVPYAPVRLAAFFGIGFALLDLVPFAPLDGHRLVVVYAEWRQLNVDRVTATAGYLWAAALIGVWAAALLTTDRFLLGAAVVATVFCGVVVVARRHLTR